MGYVIHIGRFGETPIIHFLLTIDPLEKKQRYRMLNIAASIGSMTEHAHSSPLFQET